MLILTIGLLALLTAPLAGCGAKGEEAFRVLDRDEKTKQLTVLVMGRPEAAGPIDWRPLDTRKVTPPNLPPRAVLRFQVPTAGTAEVLARVEEKFRGYEVRWQNPAMVTVEARVIDERNGRVLKELERNRPGGGTFVYDESGYDFNFVLGDEDFAAGEPPGEGERQGVFDRLHAAEGNVGIAIEVTALPEAPRAPATIRFRLDSLLDGAKGRP